ncbi:hypothetical protein BOTBODRAFT_181515 [Botryobasidium botryosum FD-172 SS1]|uniref:Uncharacterized protein n=1 Tax=Botryobasidium botryosum (strain FD-172 SS1) TaxID=930990 RepID=A0A067M4M9_BOTB1|nr:hypothetical protein BOTBODRAFT_181515 [Botryobasidium botryosum FD-172 SS1]
MAMARVSPPFCVPVASPSPSRAPAALPHSHFPGHASVFIAALVPPQPPHLPYCIPTFSLHPRRLRHNSPPPSSRPYVHLVVPVTIAALSPPLSLNPYYFFVLIQAAPRKRRRPAAQIRVFGHERGSNNHDSNSKTHLPESPHNREPPSQSRELLVGSRASGVQTIGPPVEPHAHKTRYSAPNPRQRLTLCPHRVRSRYMTATVPIHSIASPSPPSPLSHLHWFAVLSVQSPSLTTPYRVPIVPVASIANMAFRIAAIPTASLSLLPRLRPSCPHFCRLTSPSHLSCIFLLTK